MKKLLFKTLFYTIIFTIRASKKLGYGISVSLHDVPLKLIQKTVSTIEIIEEETYSCARFEENNFNVFIKR